MDLKDRRDLLASFAFSFTAITLSLFISIVDHEEQFEFITAQIFLIVGLISIFLLISMTAYVAIKRQSPAWLRMSFLNRIKIAPGYQDICFVVSLFLPVGAAFLFASANKKLTQYAWLTDLYDILFWVLVTLTAILLIILIVVNRSWMKAQTPADNGVDMVSEENESHHQPKQGVKISVKGIVQELKIKIR